MQSHELHHEFLFCFFLGEGHGRDQFIAQPNKKKRKKSVGLANEGYNQSKSREELLKPNLARVCATPISLGLNFIQTFRCKILNMI